MASSSGATDRKSELRAAREQVRARQDAARKRQRLVTVLAIAVVVTLVVSVVAIAAISRSSVSAVLPASVTEPGGPIVYGSPSAPVTVDVWEDFQCPGCAQFEAAGGAALTTLADAGDVQVRYHFMSFVGAGSAPAAAAAACAADVSPEAFKDVHAVFFANSDRLQSTDLVALAASVGVTDPAFVACVNDATYRGWVNDAQNAAARAGVQSTPRVTVDGVDVGIPTAAELAALVEQSAR